MNQWKGLLWKEWIIYKTIVYLAIVVSTLGILVGPLLIERIFNVEQNFGLHALIVSAILGSLHVLVMLFIFFSSLERDMKRPDIWFHTSASSFKLVGAKLVSMSLFTFISLVCIGVVTTIASLLFSKYNVIPIATVMKLEIGLIIAVIFSTITFTIGIFAMWVVVRLIRPISVVVSNILAIILYFFGFHNYTKFVDSEFYKKLTRYGEIELPQMSLGDFSSKNFYMTYQVSNNIFIGEIIFEIIFFTCLFIVSVYVFEKRVRG